MRQADNINARQIKAARVLLDWSQKDFAKSTGISIATIRRLEAGYMSPRGKTTNAIRECFEAVGIEFLDPDGVRKRPCGLSVFEKGHGGKDFLEDIKHTLQRYGGDVLIVTPTAETFAKYCGLPNILGLDCIIDLNRSSTIKCLITDEIEAPISTLRFRFRTISKIFMNPVPFCTYGEKYGIAVPNGEPFCKLIVVDAPKMASAARLHFESLWEKASQTAIAADSKSIVAYG